jgi:hypothetical protein
VFERCPDYMMIIVIQDDPHGRYAPESGQSVNFQLHEPTTLIRHSPSGMPFDGMLGRLNPLIKLFPPRTVTIVEEMPEVVG